MHKVFISYSSKDVESANKVLHYFEQNGLACWMAPRDIKPGAIYAQAILDAIAQSQVFLIIYSKHAQDSVQVQRETDRAVNAKLLILPLLIEVIKPQGPMEYYLCNTHWLSCTENFDQGLELALETINQSCHEQEAKSRPRSEVKKVQAKSKAKAPAKKNTISPFSIIVAVLLIFLLAYKYYPKKIAPQQPAHMSQEMVQMQGPEDRHGPEQDDGIFERRQDFKAIQAFLPSALSQKLTQKEIQSLRDPELEMLEWSILAKLGHAWNQRELQNFFKQFDWYKPDPVEGDYDRYSAHFWETKVAYPISYNLEVIGEARRDHLRQEIANEYVGTKRGSEYFIFDSLFVLPNGSLNRDVAEMAKMRSWELLNRMLESLLHEHRYLIKRSKFNEKDQLQGAPMQELVNQTGASAIIVFNLGAAPEAGFSLSYHQGSDSHKTDISMLAKSIHLSLRQNIKNQLKDGGIFPIKSAIYTVPVIFINIGRLDSEENFRLISNDKFVESVAKAIEKGVISYLQ